MIFINYEQVLYSTTLLHIFILGENNPFMSKIKDTTEATILKLQS